MYFTARCPRCGEDALWFQSEGHGENARKIVLPEDFTIYCTCEE